MPASATREGYNSEGDAMHRRLSCWSASLALLLLCASLAGLAQAQAYPLKPVRFIVPITPGGSNDVIARAIAQKLSEAWGQPVVVENRPGANGTIAVDIAAKAPPDGYTLTMISSSHSVNVTLQGHQPYDLVRDLAPITQATLQPYVLVINPALPVQSVRDLIALAKAKPGSVNFGSSGLGGFSHLAGALFGSLAGVQLTHIPYKGGAPAMADVISGQIQMLFSTLLQSHGHIAAGRLRALGVTTARRSASAPNLPTIEEAGVPGYEISGWYGLLAPAATPPAIIEKLNAAIVRILRTQEMHERLAVDGSEPVGSTSAQFGAHIRVEIAKWRRVIRELGIHAD
jgi:tripartite-type tricarboxylate transporter receptor subunit TctC